LKIINEIILSLFAYQKAINSIIKYKILKYVILLFVLLFIFVFPVVLFGETLSFFGKHIPFIDGEKYAKLTASFFSSLSGFMVLLFLIPVFTLISDEVNFYIRGVKNQFSIAQFISDIVRGLKITVRNLVYQYVVLVLLFIVLKIFSENSLFSVLSNSLIFIVTSYFYGFSLLDYAMENHKMDYTNSVKFVRSHSGLALGLGAVYFGIVQINDLSFTRSLLGNATIYWSAFAEAIVAFVGVIAANIVLNVVVKNEI